MKIDKHISTLLYGHDCVILPEFGGFVSGYAPARIEPSKHLLFPPHKNLTFNKHLRSNDGLLANEIAVAEKKTFSEATGIIRSFVAEINATLQRGEKAVIEQIGTLRLDTEKNIQFEPDHSVNYLTEAYGMGTIRFLPIKREALQPRTEKEFTDRRPIPQEKPKPRILSRLPAIASLLVIILASAIVIFSLKTTIFRQINYSDLNPFAKKTDQKVVSNSSSSLPTQNTQPSNPASSSNSVSTSNPASSSTTSASAETPAKAETPADKTAVASAKNEVVHETGAGFHIVCGCFKIKSNALHFIEKLKGKNLNAGIIGQNKDGLYIISCGDYKHKEDAYSELARVRATGSDAWMLAQ
jgi:cell division septation protein DedD